MSATINRVILVGNLGSDPEIRYSPLGTRLARLSLATTEFWKRNGERREKTDWHQVVLWNRHAEIAEEYLRKGSRIMVEGKIRNRTWFDDKGVKHFRSEIIADRMQMLGSPKTTQSFDNFGECDYYAVELTH